MSTEAALAARERPPYVAAPVVLATTMRFAHDTLARSAAVARLHHPIVTSVADLTEACATAPSLASAAVTRPAATSQWVGAHAPLRRLQERAPATLRIRLALELRRAAPPPRR